MKNQIQTLKNQFQADLEGSGTLESLKELKVRYLGKKSPISALMQELRHCSAEERPQMGKLINDLKVDVSDQLEVALSKIAENEMTERLKNESVDVTLPGRKNFKGRKHPVIQMLDEVCDILIEMGFSVQYTPEIETEYYNYGGLNYPPDHPARDMQDTFYLSEELLLRSHTTSVQQRIFEKENPPIRVIAPGKCYRNETITSRSHVFFYQVDAMYVDKGVTFADLLATKEEFYSKIFNQKVELRVRPSYFPFVEPGLEIDIKCTDCKGKGCRLCKHTGWLEVCGAGMIHPEVLKAGGIDPEVYSGYAWGGGVERLALLRHRMGDIRLFTENDLRFLSQF